MQQREPRNFREKVSRDARDSSTAIGRVVAELVGDVGVRQSKRVPLSQQLSKLSPTQLEKVEDLVASERTRRYDAEADAEYGDDDGDFSEDDDEEDAPSFWVDPVPDDQIAERQAEYDERALANMDESAREALRIVEGAARLVKQ